MARTSVLLVNPNRMRPPIAPIGIEYLASALERRGYAPVLCDLTWAEDWPAALDSAVAEVKPGAVAVSIRNVDDAYFASQDFILETTTQMIRRLVDQTDAPLVLGGVGFSTAPAEILRYTGAPYGIASEGERAFPDLLDCLAAGGDPAGVPGAVFRDADGEIRITPPARYDLSATPTPSRRFADNRRYFAEGGQAGIETKRGCDHACIYCVEPTAKGRAVRLRAPDSVAEEYADLLDQGIDTVHLCDSEFNLPPEHAFAVCDALVRHGLASRIRWYTYAAPHPFDLELARAMARAGCAGINFGCDHADPDILRRLGRPYGPAEIRRTVQACRDAGLAVMCDMLFGSPGETRETIALAIDFMRDVAPDCIGLSCGIRLYPHTPLTQCVQAQGAFESNPGLHGVLRDNDDCLKSIFYVEPSLGAGIHAVVTELVAGDKRFFHTDPAQVDGNYNYNDNSVLTNAIRQGARGAYWDILRKL